ncbi:DUF429 domain-containing protein [Rhodocyclaceae bacterium SMB388]
MPMRLHGIDFTSAPRRAKPITVASGRLDGRTVLLEGLERLPDWGVFEAFLNRPGPWLGAFDFPFGLPREAIETLGWPREWAALVRHCAALGKAGFRSTLDRHRESRPVGRRYAHRATDGPAASHSPLKLVNPPVGLMFLEGAPRLLNAGVSLPGMHVGDPARIAIEAYPGYLARAIETRSYKNDTRSRQTPERRDARRRIVTALQGGDHPLGLSLQIDETMRETLIEDASGDCLDAALALLQAAHGGCAGAPQFGLPAWFDPLEGWIATVPAPSHGNS